MTVADFRVTILNRQRSHRIDRPGLRAFVERLAELAPPPASRAEVGVCLLSDRSMHALNKRFRGIDRPTDVLSFGDGPRLPRAERAPLGEVAIAVPTAARQAREAGHSLDREVCLLALHGYLHLLGYDHERDDGRMLRLERSLRRRLLVPPQAKRERARA
jgi:probable rRNA maturation factor